MGFLKTLHWKALCGTKNGSSIAHYKTPFGTFILRVEFLKEPFFYCEKNILIIWRTFFSTIINYFVKCMLKIIHGTIDANKKNLTSTVY